MADPRLPELPPSEEAKAFRALVEILQADDVLGRVVRTWEVFDGDQKSVLPPPQGSMPWIRLRPGPSPKTRADEVSYELLFTIYFEWATEGLHADDHLNFWAAICRALVHDKPFRLTTVQQYLRLQSVAIHKVSNPGFAPFVAPSPERSSTAQDMFGAARVELLMIINY
jgi:hypothetical protein